MPVAASDSAADLPQRSRRALWHPCTQMKQLADDPPLAVARGEGPWLIGSDGRRYLDAISSWWVNLFGHCHPRINAAIIDQLGRIEHVILAGCTHAPAVELSERLAALTGLGHAFYGADGASATEIALKMSVHYWRNLGHPEKNGFVSLQNGYHGETLGALSVTDVALFKASYAPLLRHTHAWKAEVDRDILADSAREVGAPPDLIEEIRAAETARFAAERLANLGLTEAFHRRLAIKAIRSLTTHYPGAYRLTVLVCDFEGRFICRVEQEESL